MAFTRFDTLNGIAKAGCVFALFAGLVVALFETSEGEPACRKNIWNYPGSRRPLVVVLILVLSPLRPRTTATFKKRGESSRFTRQDRFERNRGSDQIGSFVTTHRTNTPLPSESFA